MRGNVLVAVAWLALASPALAGVLTSATWSQVGSGIPMTRTGLQLDITGISTASSVAVSLAFPQTTLQVFVPESLGAALLTPPLPLFVTITQGGPQAITATPALVVVDQAVPGMSVVRTALHAGMGVNQSMFGPGLNRLIEVPIRVGASGSVVLNHNILGVSHTTTVAFYGWTFGTLTFTRLTQASLPLPDVTAMGSFALSPNGGGTVTLVSARKISIDCFSTQRRQASFTTLRMVFVPEPGGLLLLAGGAIGLVLVARRR